MLFITVVKSAKNVYQALNLPKILNLNPSSAINKINQITTFIDEEYIDIASISESHDRENMRLEDHFQLASHTVISNLYQRPTKEKRGRPVIIANKEKYRIEHLTNTSIIIPWGVEMVWALLTPKTVSKDPVPKLFPPKRLKYLRSISCLISFNKIMEKVLSEIIISAMKDKIDPSQYGNQNGLSIQHYLINMITKNF